MPDIDIVFNFVIHLNPALLLLIAGHLAQWVARAWQMIPDSAARPDGAHRQEAARRARHLQDRSRRRRLGPVDMRPIKASSVNLARPAFTRIRAANRLPGRRALASKSTGTASRPTGKVTMSRGRMRASTRPHWVNSLERSGTTLAVSPDTRMRIGRTAAPFRGCHATEARTIRCTVVTGCGPPIGPSLRARRRIVARRRARLRQHLGQQAAPVSGSSLAVLVHVAAPAPCFQVFEVEGVPVLSDRHEVMHLEGEAVAPPAAPLVPLEYLQPNPLPACRPVDLRRPPASHRIVTSENCS